MKTTPLEILRRETLLKIEKLSYSITSFVQATLRDLLSTRFRPLDGILRAISSRKIRGKKRSRKRSNWINCSRQDSSSSSSSSREREKKDRNMDATYFAKRTKLVSTSEVDIEERDAVVRYMRAKFIEHVYTSAYGVCSLRERESLPRLNFHPESLATL